MKMVRLYLLPLALIVCSLFAIIKGVATMKESEEMAAKFAADKAKQAEAAAPKKTTLRSQMLYAEWLLEAAAQKVGVEIKTSPTETGVLISGTPGILEDYPKLITLLSKIDSMPYPEMRVKDLCLGSICGNGLSMLLDFGNVVRDEVADKVPAGKQGAGNSKGSTNNESKPNAANRTKIDSP